MRLVRCAGRCPEKSRHNAFVRGDGPQLVKGRIVRHEQDFGENLDTLPQHLFSHRNAYFFAKRWLRLLNLTPLSLL
jgi:hypothetical protein